MRLDDLARTATEALLADTTPDTEARLADLKRTRRNRSVARTVAAAVAIAAVVGGWAALREDGGVPQPAEPTYRNGALLISGNHIRVVRDAGEPLRLPPDYSPGGEVAFTADGSELLYENTEQQVAAVDVETGETRVVMSCPVTADCHIVPSPDGRLLAQVIDGHLRLNEMDGDGFSELDVSGIEVESVAWSPDGETLLISNLDGFYTMPTAGSEPRPLVDFTDSRPIVGSPQWSPDGRLIAFLEARPLEVVPELGMRPERLVLRLVEPDGSGLRDLQELGTCICVRHPGPDFTWAPDGTAIAATRVRARPDYMVDVRSAGVHLITLDGRSVQLAASGSGTLVWQPIPDE